MHLEAKHFTFPRLYLEDCEWLLDGEPHPIGHGILNPNNSYEEVKWEVGMKVWRLMDPRDRWEISTTPFLMDSTNSIRLGASDTKRLNLLEFSKLHANL